MKLSTFFVLFACLVNIGLISSQEEIKDNADSNSCECGQVNGQTSKYLMVNGHEVTPQNKYPWMVVLMFKNNKIFCGGAIINRHFILTAAHCIDKRLAKDIVKDLRVGFVTETDNVSEGAEIETIIMYPGFRAEDFFVNDIALVKLKNPIQCDDFARPICLPGKDISIKTGDMFTIAGRGSSSWKVIVTSKKLEETRVVVSSPETCKPRRAFAADSSKYICLISYMEESPCSGDSGGSMFRQHNGRYYTFGVTSSQFTKEPIYCTAKDSFMIFPSVQAYMPWIQNITGISPMTDDSPK